MAHNPKGGQGDGAGFGRLRATQALRHNITTLLNAKHPEADGLYVDQVREYCGAQIAFYRYDVGREQRAAVAAFSPTEDGHLLKTDTIVSKGTN